MAEPITTFIYSLTLEKALQVIIPQAIFAFSIVLYAAFIFNFYHFLAKRDIIKVDFSKYGQDLAGITSKVVLFIFSIIEPVIIFPIFVMIWFSAMSLLLILLAKGQPLESILLASISLVTAVRIAAYYKEDLSNDLAKMLPFALLGVFLIDASFFSIDRVLQLLLEIPMHFETIVYYALFVTGLEIVLTILWVIKRGLWPVEEEEED